MSTVVDRLRQGRGDFLLFGITPPKASAGPDDLARIAEATLGRLDVVRPDGLALYDIADEQDRNPDQRPFPFQATHDPAAYLREHLGGWGEDAVVYRAVGKYTEDELAAWVRDQPVDRVATVLVGASSSAQPAATSLARAYEVRSDVRPELLTGAVVIPERHVRRGDEHLRMLRKQESGVSFFVSQILFDTNAAKDLVADYRDECDARGVEPVPLVLTHSICGSVRTLEFLQWLGVQVPRWAQRDLRRAEDTLEASAEQARAFAADLVRYCRKVGVPVGLNVESVSTRRVEIEAAVDLARDLRAVLDA